MRRRRRRGERGEGREGGRSLRWQSEALISECFLLHRNKLLIYIYWEGERGVYLNPGKEALPWCAAELILHINLQSWGRDGWVGGSIIMFNIQDLRKNNNNPVHVTSRSPRPSQTFARECMCGLETRRSIGGRRGQRFLRHLGEEMGWWWGGETKASK